MACLDMSNSDHKDHCLPMSPRISFSNDFVESHHIKQERNSRDHHQDTNAVSTDFEFSITGFSMMSADQLFSKGRLLPFKHNNGSNFQMPRTIRDELLADDDDDYEEEVSLKPSKSSARWKGLLVLKGNHTAGSKKIHKSAADESGEEIRTSENSSSAFSLKDIHASESSQGLSSEEGSSCRAVEIGI